MKASKHLTSLVVLSQITSVLAVTPASRADSQKDIEVLIGYVKQSGTKVQKTDKCDASMMGFYQSPTEDGTGDRLVFCSNNIDFNDTSAVWEVLAHESAHVMQACNRGLLWKETYHPRMLRRLKEQAPHYAEILNQYRGRDKMMELEAFDMELKPASEVITLFAKFCSGDNQQPATASSGSESAESVLSIVGGEESFKALLAWARNNLSQQELQQLAATLKSENIPAIKRALVALMNRFNQAQSYENYRLF
jgi:hypothetical protein